MLNLSRYRLVTWGWLPVPYKVIDERNPLLEAVQLDQRSHVVLRTVDNQSYFSLFLWRSFRSSELV